MKISVLMSVYNGEKYLKEAIESILSQTYKKLEFIIIEDGSIDESWNILEYYAKNDSRVKIYKNDTNKGLIYSLNKGLELCTGEYIARMDADDIADKKRIENQVLFLKENNEIDLVSARIKIFKNKWKFFKIPIGKSMAPEEVAIELLFSNVIAHPTVMFKKELIKEGIKYNNEYLRREDYGLWLNLIKRNKKIQIMNEIVLNYRLVKNSESHKTIKNGLKDDHNIEKILKNELKFNEKESEIHTKIILNKREVRIKKLDEIEEHLKKIYFKISENKFFNKKILLKKISLIYLENAILISNYKNYSQSSIFKELDICKATKKEFYREKSIILTKKIFKKILR